MIHLTKGETNIIVMTLTEKQLLTNPNYLFVFTNRSSNCEVKFIKLNNTIYKHTPTKRTGTTRYAGRPTRMHMHMHTRICTCISDVEPGGSYT